MFGIHFRRGARCFFLLALGLDTLARGETVDLLPAVDTFVSTAGRDSVYGDLAHLGVGLGADSAPALQRGFLGFDLGRELAPGGVIEQAILRVYQVETSGEPAKPLHVHRVLEFWHERSMTWNNQPEVAIPGAAPDYLPTAKAGWKEVDVTGLVRDWYTGAMPNFGLSLRSDEKSASERLFASKEVNANRPHLRLTLADQTVNPRDNRGIERVEVLEGPGGGTHYIRVVWHGQASRLHPAPAERRDFSAEIQVRVNGKLIHAAQQLLVYEPPAGSGGGGGLDCHGSYPVCDGACPGMWIFDGGEGEGGCKKHADPAVEECVCQSPPILEDLLAVEELKRSDLIEALILPKPWLRCPPFCPPGPDPWFVEDPFPGDDQYSLVFEGSSQSPRFRRGDSNQSGKVDLADAIHLFGYLFSGGKQPGCLESADMNGDGRLVISDGIYLLGHLFRGSPAPPPPFDSCGALPGKDLLGCARFAGCVEPSCPDPRAASIQFRVLSQTTPFQGRVRITGIVTNDGAAFESSPGQQAAALYEEIPGAGARRVSTREFEDLAPGESVSLTYDRDWDTAIEFPPSYRLVISYDPDIFIDGNPRNDDCDQDNNQLERSGEDMNPLFD